MNFCLFANILRVSNDALRSRGKDEGGGPRRNLRIENVLRGLAAAVAAKYVKTDSRRTLRVVL